MSANNALPQPTWPHNNTKKRHTREYIPYHGHRRCNKEQSFESRKYAIITPNHLERDLSQSRVHEAANEGRLRRKGEIEGDIIIELRLTDLEDRDIGVLQKGTGLSSLHLRSDNNTGFFVLFN
jgi:hypothetical protein